MNFWKNVDYVREYREISRKELAYKADFSIASFSTGIARNSIPAADVAFRIAKVLNVSIEYLLTGKEENKDSSPKDNMPQIEFLNNRDLINKFEALPKAFQTSITSLIEESFKLVSKSK